MDVKRCSKCKTSKETACFYKSKKTKNGLDSWCKQCHNDAFKARYKSDPELRARKYEAKKKYKNKKIEAIKLHLQANPCVDCGEADLRVLEFDHIDPSTKTACVSYYLTNNSSIHKMLEEIKKCEVRCANCHKKRTANQQNWWSNN